MLLAKLAACVRAARCVVVSFFNWISCLSTVTTCPQVRFLSRPLLHDRPSSLPPAVPHSCLSLYVPLRSVHFLYSSVTVTAMQCLTVATCHCYGYAVPHSGHLSLLRLCSASQWPPVTVTAMQCLTVATCHCYGYAVPHSGHLSLLRLCSASQWPTLTVTAMQCLTVATCHCYGYAVPHSGHSCVPIFFLSVSFLFLKQRHLVSSLSHFFVSSIRFLYLS